MPNSVDYNKLWLNTWGDAQRLGPSHRTHRRIMLKMLKELSFQSVLEVGAGNGLNLGVLNNFRAGLTLNATDISSEAGRQLKQSLPNINFTQIDITREYIPEKYDLIICTDVLEHLESDMEALLNMAQMAGKYLFLTTLQGKMRKFEKKIGHVRNYSAGELEQKVASAGFSVIHTVEWGWPLFSPLYRDYLDRLGGQNLTTGKFGIFRKIACQILYGLFLLNSNKKGDMIFLLAEK